MLRAFRLDWGPPVWTPAYRLGGRASLLGRGASRLGLGLHLDWRPSGLKTFRLEWALPVWAESVPPGGGSAGLGRGACRLGWGLPYGLEVSHLNKDCPSRLSGLGWTGLAIWAERPPVLAKGPLVWAGVCLWAGSLPVSFHQTPR